METENLHLKNENKFLNEKLKFFENQIDTMNEKNKMEQNQNDRKNKKFEKKN
jgi:hypothetical protein